MQNFKQEKIDANNHVSSSSPSLSPSLSPSSRHDKLQSVTSSSGSKPSHFEIYSTIVLEYKDHCSIRNQTCFGRSNPPYMGEATNIHLFPSSSSCTQLSHVSNIESQICKSSQRIKAISHGEYHSFYIYENGQAYGIGDNSKYQLSIRPFTLSNVNHLRRVQLPNYYQGHGPNAQNNCCNHQNQHQHQHQHHHSTQPLIQRISSKYDHTLFLTLDGKLYSCGCNNQHGQLGNGTFMSSHVPYPIMLDKRCNNIYTTNTTTTFIGHRDTTNNGVTFQVTLIATGKEHSLWVAESSTQSILYGCGSNRFSQLSKKSCGGFLHSTLTSTTQPIEIMTLTHDTFPSMNSHTMHTNNTIPSSKIKKIDCGHFHNAVLCQNGDLYMFGRNDKCQCFLSNDHVERRMHSVVVSPMASSHPTCTHRSISTNQVISEPRVVLSQIEDVSCGEDFTAALSHSYLYMTKNSSSKFMTIVPLTSLYKLHDQVVCGLGTLSHHRTVLLLKRIEESLVHKELHVKILNEEGQWIQSWKYEGGNRMTMSDHSMMNLEPYRDSVLKKRKVNYEELKDDFNRELVFQPKHDLHCQCGACFTTKVMLSCGKDSMTILIEQYCHYIYRAYCNHQLCDISFQTCT
ncbi:hypothetical protein C9374_010428 [Naegleria lovaniensis]|uniref:Uncharacterized protein n=1 Tax=Naegleria lovaniensis TaxID=51637 RepID=A0AA88GHI1_NAELO|nr:uncharacterized protein C9374_010428 [Naegleria lovaniensis]KAG2374684.1 hypothetical protein C9374_010428 [Naegleria lovaniensis]